MSASTLPQTREIAYRSKQLAEKISESLCVASHDPSMALYRLQEHIAKTAPLLVQRKYTNIQLNAALTNASVDLDTAAQTLMQMQATSSTFERMHHNLKNSIFFKQQQNFEQERARVSGRPSI